VIRGPDKKEKRWLKIDYFSKPANVDGWSVVKSFDKICDYNRFIQKEKYILLSVSFAIEPGGSLL